jgi:hypothetical protein
LRIPTPFHSSVLRARLHCRSISFDPATNLFSEYEKQNVSLWHSTTILRQNKQAHAV